MNDLEYYMRTCGMLRKDMEQLRSQIRAKIEEWRNENHCLNHGCDYDECRDECADELEALIGTRPPPLGVGGE